MKLTLAFFSSSFSMLPKKSGQKVNLKGALSGLMKFLAAESPLKWWKMLFISPWKLFSFLKYLNFCFDFLVVWKNGLIRKINLISKFVTSQSGYQTIAIHMLTNISRSKGNQAMKFGQLIEHNMKNIFLKKSYAKCGTETTPSPFSKKSKLSISLDQQPKVLCNLFSLNTKLWTIAVYWN